jgi:hypothetical protein
MNVVQCCFDHKFRLSDASNCTCHLPDRKMNGVVQIVGLKRWKLRKILAREACNEIWQEKKLNDMVESRKS